MLRGRIASINMSRGGVPKTSVAEALVTEAGLRGDLQRDLRYHGGPDRAVVLFSSEIIQALRREGHPIDAGTIGENLTLSDLDWTALAPGMEMRIGPVRLHITKYASPCEIIRHSLADEEFMRVSQKRHPGWSRLCARVLSGGTVRVGDVVEAFWPREADAGRTAG